MPNKNEDSLRTMLILECLIFKKFLFLLACNLGETDSLQMTKVTPLNHNKYSFQ